MDEWERIDEEGELINDSLRLLWGEGGALDLEDRVWNYEGGRKKN